jgi:hypothetical protein
VERYQDEEAEVDWQYWNEEVEVDTKVGLSITNPFPYYSLSQTFKHYSICPNLTVLVFFMLLEYMRSLRIHTIVEDCDLITVEGYHQVTVEDFDLTTVKVYHVVTVEDYYLVVVEVYLYYLIIL